MTNLRALNAAARKRVSGLDIPHPLDRPVVAASVAARTGRQIALRTQQGSMTGGPAVVCKATAFVDFLYLDPTADAHQVDLALLHQLGHLLSSTTPGRCPGPEAPTVDHRLREHFLPDEQMDQPERRYTADDEAEAELIARLLAGEADLDRRPAPSVPAHAAPHNRFLWPLNEQPTSAFCNQVPARTRSARTYLAA